MPKRINSYKIPDDIFIETIKQSRSIRDALLRLGLTETGSAYRVFRRRIIELKVSTTHFLGKGYLRGKTHNWATRIPLKDILVENSTYTNTNALKHRLIKEGALKYACKHCGINEWQGEQLSLHIDHVNGDNKDNRLCNLRLLCPNCHSLTSTFAGRNKRKS